MHSDGLVPSAGTKVETRRSSEQHLPIGCHPVNGLIRTLMSEALTARHVALDLIGAVLRRKRPLDDAIEDSPAMHQLSGRDRAFARLLVATVLRRLGQIDALIADCLNMPLAPRAAVVHDILRLGVAQLLFLRTPPHAAVATSVDIAQSCGFRVAQGAGQRGVAALERRRRRPCRGAGCPASQHAGLAVAVVEQDLRRTDRSGDRHRASEGGAARSDIARRCRDVVRRSSTGSCCRPGRCAGRRAARSRPCPAMPRAPGGSRTRPPRCRRGCSAISPDARSIDLCAAPGGKTAQLATAGARVTAVDRSTRRLDRLVANLAAARPAGRGGRGRRADLASAASGRRGAARRAVQHDRRDPPPPRRAASQSAGRCRAAFGGAGEFVAGGDRHAAARRHFGLLHLLAGAGGRAGTHRSAALRRRAGRAARDRARRDRRARPNGSPPRAICGPCRAISANMTASTASTAHGW